uniref:Uncharacterized protein n=1 Tax=Arundo donax TaxID=35708 RepID=A0A0A9CKX1_ARUDO
MDAIAFPRAQISASPHHLARAGSSNRKQPAPAPAATTQTEPPTRRKLPPFSPRSPKSH